MKEWNGQFLKCVIKWLLSAFREKIYGLCGNFDGSKTQDLSRPGNPTDSLLQEQMNNAVDLECQASVPQQPDWNNLGCPVRLVLLTIYMTVASFRNKNKYCTASIKKIKNFNLICFRFLVKCCAKDI